MSALQCAQRSLDLTSPKVMGVLNVTPDSFSDGGEYFDAGGRSLDKALTQVARMVSEGAAIIDVGGESTRPGAEPVSESEEQDRVLPIVEAINREFSTIISVDTSTASVMREAAALGAGMINDVRALTRLGALEAARDSDLPICLMHMQGEPVSMQDKPAYVDVVDEVIDFLSARIDVCVEAGIDRHRLLVDPGFGFGKTLQHNLRLLNGLPQLESLGLPVLVGLSRKSMIGHILQSEVHERLTGSIILAVMAAERGAGIVRVHDIKETVAALQVVSAVVKGC